MTHIATIIASKVEGTNAAAFCFRCCNDSTTDHWHTIYNPYLLDVPSLLSNTKQAVESRHAGMLHGVDHTKQLAATTRTLGAHHVSFTYKQINDEQIMVTYQCCGIPTSVSYIVGPQHKLTDEQRETAVWTRAQEAADQHATLDWAKANPKPV